MGKSDRLDNLRFSQLYYCKLGAGWVKPGLIVRISDDWFELTFTSIPLFEFIHVIYLSLIKQQGLNLKQAIHIKQGVIWRISHIRKP